MLNTSKSNLVLDFLFYSIKRNGFLVFPQNANFHTQLLLAWQAECAGTRTTWRKGWDRKETWKRKARALVRILVFPGAGLKKPAVGKHLHKERCRIVRATLNSFPERNFLFLFSTDFVWSDYSISFGSARSCHCSYTRWVASLFRPLHSSSHAFLSWTNPTRRFPTSLSS